VKIIDPEKAPLVMKSPLLTSKIGDVRVDVVVASNYRMSPKSKSTKLDVFS
jgi:hypothetical protein